MNFAIDDAVAPGSPPDLTGSKSSKSSSFHSYQSDEGSILENGNHFEEIGLGDDDDDGDAQTEREIGEFAVKISSNPYHPTYTADLRSTVKKQQQRSRGPIMVVQTTNARSHRELTSAKSRPNFTNLRGQVRSVTTPTDGLGLLPLHTVNTNMSKRGFSSPTTNTLPLAGRRRTPSPAYLRSPEHIRAVSPDTRRGSWQSTRERKTALELEKECDEDEGEDLPDEFILENVPMSPRPPHERIKSTPPSTSTSPERKPKERVRSVGNGTSPLPVETGCLRSPKPGVVRAASMGQFPIHNSIPKGRAKSWTSALSALSEEAKALTAALEAHAVEEEARMMDPKQRRSFNVAARPAAKPLRVRSAIAELPPLRRTETMIDPLPISKEKEAVLSRTRPSWLPPKNPAEERRHVKEYQQMMAKALEAEQRKEVEKNSRTVCRDDTANSLLRIWEEHVLPNWDNVTRQKRTRELWWRGIAPRSRGAVWTRAIGNDLELTDASYKAALTRAQDLEKRMKQTDKLDENDERTKKWFGRIEKDVCETYKDLRIFQRDGPLHGPLMDVLRAYAMYRNDVGYVQGTSTIAAILLLNLPSSSSTFITLSNIMNRPLPLSFHTHDSGAISKAYGLILSTLKTKSPRLHEHLTSISTNPDVYLRPIFTSLFTETLNLDNATRLWDVMVFEGDAAFVRGGVTYLLSLEGSLFGAGCEADIGRIMATGIDLGEADWMTALREAGKS